MADWSRFNTQRWKDRTVNAVQNSNIEMMRRSLCCLAERVWVHTCGGSTAPTPPPLPGPFLPAIGVVVRSSLRFSGGIELKQVHAAGIPEAVRSAEGRTRVCLFLATCISLRRRGLSRVLLLGQQDSYPCVTYSGDSTSMGFLVLPSLKWENLEQDLYGCFCHKCFIIARPSTCCGLDWVKVEHESILTKTTCCVICPQ